MRKALYSSLVLFAALAGCQKSVSSGGGTPGSATPLCGNGVVDFGEFCDPCPSSCDDGVACTEDVLTGSGCRVRCENEPIRFCAADDGCCPTACNAGTDNDCSATCGDGVVDANETCDGDCEDCVAPDSCSTVQQYGSARNCNLECAFDSSAQCGANDGCCPTGCTNAQDADCSSSCGDGVLDPGETCDGDCPTACPSSGCETAMLLGDAMTCTATCAFSTISMCANGDACCPEGCDGQDDDCGGVPSGQIGDPCASQEACVALLADETATCLTPFPDGYCAKQCVSNGDCPANTLCQLQLNVCMRICDPEGADCRVGYTCQQSVDVDEDPFFTCGPTPE